MVFSGKIYVGLKCHKEGVYMGTGLYSIVSGLCLLLVFVLYTRMVTRVVRTEKRDVYVDIMTIGMIYLATDVLWGVIYDDLLPIPISLQRMIYAVYYSASALLSYRWFAYVEYMQGSIFYKNTWARRLIKIPMLFVVVVAVASIWTGSFFYINDAGAYCRGPLYVEQLVFTYGYILFAAFKLLIRIFMTRDFQEQNTYMTMISYFIFPVVFGILQVTAPEMPYLCIGISLATLQTYLFNVNFEMERERSSSKIHSFTRLFISSYYLDLKNGKREYLSNQEEKIEEYLTGEFYKEAPQSYEDAVQAYAETYVHRDDRENYRSLCQRSYMEKHLNADNLFYSFNYRQVTGKIEKWYRMHVIAASFLPSGAVSHVVMSVMDVDNQISNEIQQQKALEDALVQAENANRAKSTFLSNMSHDIRTPMNAIIGFTNLAQTHLDEKDLVKNYLEKIVSASGHLLSLINDILDMSRIESGKIQIQEDEMSIADTVKEIKNLIQPMAEDKKLRFVIDMDIRNKYIYCDKLRLHQILINLLGNAVKFTPEGGEIALQINQELEAPDGYGVYIFKVRDTGIGVAPEFLESIFKAFEREKTTVEKGIQGTGLGLAITKSIVELMGGKISVESTLGEGTEFTVKVVFMLQDVEDENMLTTESVTQLQLREDTNRRAEQQNLFAGKKILLVEDNNLNREIARMLLTEAGFVVDEAADGQVAVQKVQSAEPGEYAVVLMDIQMPIMDGYEATKQIRRLSQRAKANVPILAMTANAFAEERKKAMSCGMNGHISKPINIDVLFDTIEGIIK